MYSMNMMMSSLLHRFKSRMHFHWRKTYVKHNKIPIISHICAFVTLIPYLCKKLNRCRNRYEVSMNNTNIILLHVVRIAQNAISTMAFGTRPLLYELFKFFNIIGIFYLLREIIPEFIPKLLVRTSGCINFDPPLSSYGWSWYANIFFRKIGLMFSTHLNISIAMAFIRDT